MLILGKYSSKHALTGLLICGECGTPYRRVVWTQKGMKRPVWRCVNRIDHGRTYCKRSPTLDEKPLQQAVLATVNILMSRKDVLADGVASEMAQEAGDETHAKFTAAATSRGQRRARGWTSPKGALKEAAGMIYVTGDTHRNFSRFSPDRFPEMKTMTKADTILVCGDFGALWHGGRRDEIQLAILEDQPFTIAFVDGNHENFTALSKYRDRGAQWPELQCQNRRCAPSGSLRPGPAQCGNQAACGSSRPDTGTSIHRLLPPGGLQIQPHQDQLQVHGASNSGDNRMDRTRYLEHRRRLLRER